MSIYEVGSAAARLHKFMDQEMGQADIGLMHRALGCCFISLYVKLLFSRQRRDRVC